MKKKLSIKKSRKLRIKEFEQALVDKQKPLPLEFQKVINDNFWDLI